MNKKQNKGGRNPKIDPAVYRYYVRFNSKEHERFLHMFERSGMAHPSVFTFDKGLHEYYTKLSDFHAQFRMVGNNYNQTLKELKSHFSERRAMALTYKLEKYMQQLVEIATKIVELTNEYQQKWSQR